jgi:ClpP class serine protease
MMTATDTLANDIGTLLEGEEAVRCGLIDELGGLSEALEALRAMAGKSKD